VLETGRSEMKRENFIETMVISIYIVLVLFGGLLYKKLDDTQNEWKQIVVKQGEHIKKLAEQNKAQDVIINKLNAEYNLKGKKK
jgi:cell division protein YceG involved in septum cleavage